MYPTRDDNSGGGGGGGEYASSIIGEIKTFCGNYAPGGWLICDGSTLAIQSYTALFSIIGTRFGGDGHISFNLPDLRGHIPLYNSETNSFNKIGMFANC